MLNKKTFELLVHRILQVYGHRDLRINPMELLIRDNIAVILESRIQQAMGSFGPIRSPNRERREQRCPMMVMSDFHVMDPQSGAQLTCTVFQPEETWEEALFRTSKVTIVIRNVGYVPPVEDPPADGDTGRSKSAFRAESRSVSFGEESFDPEALKMFLALLDQVTTEVLLKSMFEPEYAKAKVFQPRQLVYRLGNPDKVTAAHVVHSVGLNVLEDSGDVKDMQVKALTTQRVSLAYSGDFGNELEWITATTGGNRAAESSAREWPDATDEEVVYIQDVMGRISAIM